MTILGLICAATILCSVQSTELDLSFAKDQFSVDSSDDTLAIVGQRLYTFFLQYGDCTQNGNLSLLFCGLGECEGTCNASCGSSLEYFKNLRSDSTWADINYQDKTLSSWNTSVHLQRVVSMARATKCPDCQALFQNASALSQLYGALSYWIQHDPQNPNWWWNDFGTSRPSFRFSFLFSCLFSLFFFGSF